LLKKQALNKRIKAQFISLLGDLDLSIADALLEVFFSTDDHVTVSDLHNKLKTMSADIGRDEIKKALHTLVEYGFARELKFEGAEETAYEHSHLGIHHDHFICTRCGAVFEFEDPEIESNGVKKEKSFFVSGKDYAASVHGEMGCNRSPDPPDSGVHLHGHASRDPGAARSHLPRDPFRAACGQAAL